MAHRFSYTFYVGEIPEGLDIDHLCRNPSCVNYEHMEPITKVENSKRAHERTHKNDGYWGMSGQRLHYLRGQARALRGIGLPDSYIARRLGITKRQVMRVREG